MFRPIRNQNGIALVTIVLVLLMLTILGYAALSNSMIGFKIANNDKFATGALQNADAGIADAARQLVNGTIADSGYPPGNPSWSYTSSTTGFNNSYTVSYLLANGGIVLDSNGSPYYKIDSTGYFPATGNGIQRNIRGLVQMNQKFFFGWGCFGDQWVQIGGSSAVFNSYNSSTDPNHTKLLGHANIGTNANKITSGLPYPINLLNSSKVNGNATVGPGGSTSDISVQSGCTLTGSKIVATSATDMTPVTDPGGGSTLTINGGTQTINAGNYQVAGITLGTGSTLTINGKVTLHVTDNINLNDNSTITISPGASLTIYMSGAGFNMGKANINSGGLPKNFILYGTSTCTALNFNSGTNFYGAVYAPNANANVSMGGGSFCGAILAKSITANNPFPFYYDESLKNMGTPITGFKLISWRET